VNRIDEVCEPQYEEIPVDAVVIDKVDSPQRESSQKPLNGSIDRSSITDAKERSQILIEEDDSDSEFEEFDANELTVKERESFGRSFGRSWSQSTTDVRQLHVNRIDEVCEPQYEEIPVDAVVIDKVDSPQRESSQKPLNGSIDRSSITDAKERSQILIEEDDSDSEFEEFDANELTVKERPQYPKSLRASSLRNSSSESIRNTSSDKLVTSSSFADEVRSLSVSFSQSIETETKFGYDDVYAYFAASNEHDNRDNNDLSNKINGDIDQSGASISVNEKPLHSSERRVVRDNGSQSNRNCSDSSVQPTIVVSDESNIDSPHSEASEPSVSSTITVTKTTDIDNTLNENTDNRILSSTAPDNSLVGEVSTSLAQQIIPIQSGDAITTSASSDVYFSLESFDSNKSSDVYHSARSETTLSPESHQTQSSTTYSDFNEDLVTSKSNST
jgi:hypothetical protein